MNTCLENGGKNTKYRFRNRFFERIKREKNQTDYVILNVKFKYHFVFFSFFIFCLTRVKENVQKERRKNYFPLSWSYACWLRILKWTCTHVFADLKENFFFQWVLIYLIIIQKWIIWISCASGTAFDYPCKIFLRAVHFFRHFRHP